MMIAKRAKLFSLIALFFLLIIAVYYLNKYNFDVFVILASSFFSCFLRLIICSYQDIKDSTAWMTMQRKLLRAGLIKNDTLIRISFAYLYRIKVDSDYFLIKNARGTEKYQPVGGVYKMGKSEKEFLNRNFNVLDDDKVPIDESSRNDYRLQVHCHFLREFVERFDNGSAEHERIRDLSREFQEELSKLIDWKEIKYRYCGRHMTSLEYSKHFRCYELLLADIVELIPSDKQRQDLETLRRQTSDSYCFATAERIKGLGVIAGTENLKEGIADHTIKILQETEQELIKKTNCGNVFKVSLRMLKN